jgi:hypothetical protein
VEDGMSKDLREAQDYVNQALNHYPGIDEEAVAGLFEDLVAAAAIEDHHGRRMRLLNIASDAISGSYSAQQYAL